MNKSDFKKLADKILNEDFNYLQENTNEGARKVSDNSFEPANGNENWTCKKCGGTIQGFTVAFSIHDGFSLFGGKHAGSGRCQYIERPYCPKCDGRDAEKLGYKSHGGCIDL